jgi:hypothetical protein
MTLATLLRLAGFGQIALALASLAIPGELRWREETGKLRPLLRRLFWVYGGYIFATNLAMGALSAAAPTALLDGSTLAAAVTGFIAVYWGARLAIQFLVFDRSGDVPQGARFRAAEAAMVALFAFLTAVYGGAFLENVRR